MTTRHEPIQVATVADDQRLAFMPKHFGKQMMRVEGNVYTFAGNLLEGYDGGYWEFREASNGAGYMVPPKPATPTGLYRCSGPLTTADVELSADAAGIVVTIFALTLAVEHSENLGSIWLIAKIDALKDVAYEHAECGAILRAID